MTAPTGTPATSSPRPRSKGARAAEWTAGLLFGLAVAYGVFVLFNRYGPGDANPRVLGYEVLSDTAISITFDVTKDPDVEAVCLVRSRGADLGEAGHADVRVPKSPTGERTTVITHTLTTTSRAQTGEVLRCQVLEPGEPLPTHDPGPSAPAPGVS